MSIVTLFITLVTKSHDPLGRQIRVHGVWGVGDVRTGACKGHTIYLRVCTGKAGGVLFMIFVGLGFRV